MAKSPSLILPTTSKRDTILLTNPLLCGNISHTVKPPHNLLDPLRSLTTNSPSTPIASPLSPSTSTTPPLLRTVAGLQTSRRHGEETLVVEVTRSRTRGLSGGGTRQSFNVSIDPTDLTTPPISPLSTPNPYLLSITYSPPMLSFLDHFSSLQNKAPTYRLDV
ncbi:hypothetical protein BT69DRAFT_1332024 [Atractiella rhizophila]|nr:hypothetical protein BT69DRAFT_1332024 [Atractiella rhizophila]